jgi:hypothetical protein
MDAPEVPHRDTLDELFNLKRRKSWITLTPARGVSLKGFQTRRVGKVVGDELLFTIGATSLGKHRGLNRVIREILQTESLDVIERESTSGTRQGDAVYLGCSLASVDAPTLRKIVARVVGATVAIQQDEL